QSDANGAARPDVESLQNANRLHHDNASRPIVGGAGSGEPGIEMRPEHDDLIFLIAAGNLGNGVVLHGIVIVESVRDIHFQGHFLLLIEQAGDAVPVLRSHGELRNSCGLSGLVGSAGLHEDSAATRASTAMINDRENFFIREKLVEIFLKLAPAKEFRHAEWRTLSRDLIFADLRKLLIAKPLGRRVDHGLDVRIGTEDYDHARQLAPVFIEILLIFDIGADAFSRNHAVSAGSPCLSVNNQRNQVGRKHARMDVLIRPAAAKRPPGLEMRVDQAHLCKLVARPFVGTFHVGGPGQPLADPVHQAGRQFHHPGIAEALVPDAGNRFQVNFFLGRCGGDHQQNQYNRGKKAGRPRHAFRSFGQINRGLYTPACERRPDAWVTVSHLHSNRGTASRKREAIGLFRASDRWPEPPVLSAFRQSRWSTTCSDRRCAVDSSDVFGSRSKYPHSWAATAWYFSWETALDRIPQSDARPATGFRAWAGPSRLPCGGFGICRR